MLVTLSVLTLVTVAACGDDDDTTTATTVAGTDAVESGTEPESAATSTEPESTEGSTTTESGGSATTEGGSGAAQPAPGPGERHIEDEGEPVKGGTLVFGLEADTANAWPPYRASLATSGLVPITSVSDSLFQVTDEGEIVPLLVESVENNDDYTEWTLHIRDGIKFHDGTPLDGAAVKFNIDALRAAPLTAGTLTPIDTVTASGQDVVITIKNGPWVALPAYFAGGGSLGYMFSPTWLASLPDIPQRTEGGPVFDAAVAATPANGDPAKPIGLGAFKFESYTPGNGNAFRAVRNDDYWRGPNGITGEDLPYLDAIEAVVAVDIDSRQAALRSGQFDAMHTANSDTISQMIDDDSLEVTATSRYGDTSYYLINEAERRRRSTRKARTRPAPCSTSTAARRWPTRWTASAWSRSAAPGWWRPPTGRSRPDRSATSRTTATRSSTWTWRTRRWTSACRSSAPIASSSRSTRRTTRSTSRPAAS